MPNAEPELAYSHEDVVRCRFCGKKVTHRAVKVVVAQWIVEAAEQRGLIGGAIGMIVPLQHIGIFVQSSLATKCNRCKNLDEKQIIV